MFSGEVTLNKHLKNKMVLQPAPGPLKEPPIYGNRCGFDQKWKNCPYKEGMNWLNLYKSSNLRL